MNDKLNGTDDFQYLPMQEAIRPTRGVYFQLMLDHWWCVHPDKGLAFFNPTHPVTGRRRHAGLGSPQCNTDRRIQEMMQIRDSAPPSTSVQFVERVWVPIYLRDLG